MILRLALALGVVAVTAGPAAACALCLSPVALTPVQPIDPADRVVLALVTKDGAAWRLVKVIKQAEQPGADPVGADVPPGAPVPDKQVAAHAAEGPASVAPLSNPGWQPEGEASRYGRDRSCREGQEIAIVRQRRHDAHGLGGELSHDHAL